MFKPKEIDFERAENIKTILKLENMTQAKFAERINMSPENLNRIIKLRHPLREATAELICEYFPKYRLNWLLGYDSYMTEEEKSRAKDLGIRNNAPLTVLDTALLTVCRREGIDPPKLDNIPEMILLVNQLEDYAEMLMSNYIHRDRSHVWRYIDQTVERIEEKLNE